MNIIREKKREDEEGRKGGGREGKKVEKEAL